MSAARQFAACLDSVQAAPTTADSIVRLFDRMSPSDALETIARALNADWVARADDAICGDIDDARQLVEHALDNCPTPAVSFRDDAADRQYFERVAA